MRAILLYVWLLIVAASCQDASSSKTNDDLVIRPHVLATDTVIETVAKPYSDLEFLKKDLLISAPGTKSVVFNSSGSRLYAMNLEGMSVYEFDRIAKKITREFKFKPTPGMGWDYNRSRAIASYQEKPVEACFSHGDKILWVSLHNAEGIVPIWVDDIEKNNGIQSADQKTKPITVLYPGSNRRDSFNVPLISTGKTPKVIAKTADSKHLLVSNWHSHTVSVLELNDELYPYGRVISTVPVTAIPRGIAVDEKTNRSFIAIMGGSTLTVINNETWKEDTSINVLSSPRHIVMDSTGHLFVSFNSLAMVGCMDANTGKMLFSAPTHSNPRTIVLSKNNKFLFVTCYKGDMIDVYKINPDSFTKIASLPCGGHPVGVDIYEDNDILEAWVCSYSSGSINVYTFKKL
jgi:DNA-binding beta-propeller fold protein YncE